MNEAFCFWSFTQWKQVLAETGFRITENPNAPNSGSRVYTNPWIVEQRYRGRVAILDAGHGGDLPFPPTNMVLAAEKPLDS
jgi:hypothetical protein